MLKDIDLTTLHSIANAVEQSLGDLLTDNQTEELRTTSR